MLDAGTLILGAGRTLRLPDQRGMVVGTFRLQRRGFGFLERPGHPDVYIPRNRTGSALDGDTVAVRLLKRPYHVPGPRAQVVRVIERAPLHWVGILEQVGSRWVVRPEGPTPRPPVLVETPDTPEGELVVVQPDERSLGTHRVRGKIIERLGDPRDANARIRGTILQYGLPTAFPPNVQRAARRAASQFKPDDITGREDLRSLLTITIDPAEARDFDDAISVERLAGGRVRLGVHIADVAHFVPAEGVLDKEARRRGNSVYFPGTVIPMLPEALSNEVCSLKPDVPRFTRSVFITYDDKAEILDARIAHSVIRSAARLTYEQATAAIAGREPGVLPPVRRLLKDAEDLARRIRRRRLKHGMIVLVVPEVHIELGKQGRVRHAGPADTSFSHTIIEMFMVEANETVSRTLRHAGLPHLRRVHPAPDPDSAAQLSHLDLLLEQRPPSRLDRESILALLDRVHGGPQHRVTSYTLLRAMPQACYSPAAEGHFALASEDYCHFTSPVRRYPDLTIHRLLDVIMTPGGKPLTKRQEQAILTEEALVELGRRTSAAERRALQAERDAEKALLVNFMEDKIGQTFDGIVTGVMSFGAFVQIDPFLAEGLIRLGDFGPESWRFDRQAGVIYGLRTERVVHLGLAVRVRVAGVDVFSQELSLVPADDRPLGRALPNGVPRASAPRRGRRGRRRQD
jgi:ribonuclease R